MPEPFQKVCALIPLPGGASRDRTDDPLLAKQVLSQLSYGPDVRDTLWMQVSCVDALGWRSRSRKEVIQPHLPIRLPCYDFVPLTGHTFGTSLSCELGQ